MSLVHSNDQETNMLKFLLFKRKPAPTTREAIQKSSEMESMLEKKLAHLNSKIDEQKKLAAANAKTNKKVALSALNPFSPG